MQALPICRLGLCKPLLNPSDFSRATALLSQDSSAALLQGVSILELCLIIAMKNITELSDGEPFNFEMVYNGRFNII